MAGSIVVISWKTSSHLASFEYHIFCSLTLIFSDWQEKNKSRNQFLPCPHYRLTCRRQILPQPHPNPRRRRLCPQ